MVALGGARHGYDLEGNMEEVSAVLGILYILTWTLVHGYVQFVKIHPVVCL